MTEVVCPGKRLGRASEFRAGPGTYVRGTYIYASVVGPKVEQAAADEDGKPFLVVSASLIIMLQQYGSTSMKNGVLAKLADLSKQTNKSHAIALHTVHNHHLSLRSTESVLHKTYMLSDVLLRYLCIAVWCIVSPRLPVVLRIEHLYVGATKYNSSSTAVVYTSYNLRVES